MLGFKDEKSKRLAFSNYGNTYSGAAMIGLTAIWTKQKQGF